METKNRGKQSKPLTSVQSSGGPKPSWITMFPSYQLDEFTKYVTTWLHMYILLPIRFIVLQVTPCFTLLQSCRAPTAWKSCWAAGWCRFTWHVCECAFFAFSGVWSPLTASLVLLPLVVNLNVKRQILVQSAKPRSRVCVRARRACTCVVYCISISYLLFMLTV